MKAARGTIRLEEEYVSCREWENFTATGKVEDYLKFKAVEKREEKIAGESRGRKDSAGTDQGNRHGDHGTAGGRI